MWRRFLYRQWRATTACVVILFISSTMSLAAGEPAAPVIMKQHTLTDPGMGGMQSHTILAPDGWKVEGGAWWPGPNYFRILPSQDIKVIAPDGRMVHVGPSIAAVDFWPSQYSQQLGAQRPAEGAADNGNLVLYMPQNPDQWNSFVLDKAFKTSFPNATNMHIDNVTVIPELTQILQTQLQPIRQQQALSDQQAQMMGMAQQSFCDGAAMAATCFYEEGGRKWEHMIVFATAQLGSETQIGRQIFWSIEPCVSYRAEAGQLDANMPLMMAIANSMRPTTEWARMKADHVAKMQQIDAKGAADRANIIAQSNREINKIITDGYNERQASQDRTHEAFIKSIRGVEDYTVAGSGTSVQLPNTYEHVYTNNNGVYILSNDSNFNPNTDPSYNQKTWDTMEISKN